MAASERNGTKHYMWRKRLHLVRDACLDKNPEAGRRIARRALYKFFKRFYREYYVYEAKRRASIVDWGKVYCGGQKGLVSIVLPVYNQADLLEESIDSVLNQEYEDFELIIVNDGSTDGIESVLDKYLDHPKVVILSQKNCKLPAALNTGFSRAQGEFFTWTSADNIMLPSQLHEQVAFLREHDFVHMVFGNYELINENGRAFQHSELTLPGTNIVDTNQDIRALNYTYNFINASFLYRRYVALVIGNYAPDTYGAEDYDYWMRVNDHFEIHHIGRKTSYYKYRLHGNTILSREGNRAINQAIAKTQEIDFDRKSFFRSPITFYLPKAFCTEETSSRLISMQQNFRVLAFEDLEAFLSMLISIPKDEKAGLFLTQDEMSRQECVSLLNHCSRQRMLFTFGIVQHYSTPKEDILKLLDWIIVDTLESYRSLRELHEHKLICLPNWHNNLGLCSVIANHRLFYKQSGGTALHPVPEHFIYKKKRKK